jgi:hypothetical protein
MNNIPISIIDDFKEVVTKTVSGFRVIINSIVLNKSADLLVELYDSSGNFLNVQLITMSGTDYKNWKDDDNYVYTYVAEKLGYNIIAVPFTD